jgi:hypothetical protein
MKGEGRRHTYRRATQTRGVPHPSDIDLLIVKKTQERFLDRVDTVRRTVTGLHPRIPLEPIVMTPDEIAERLSKGDQFVAEIIERGEVLYAA